MCGRITLLTRDEIAAAVRAVEAARHDPGMRGLPSRFEADWDARSFDTREPLLSSGIDHVIAREQARPGKCVPVLALRDGRVWHSEAVWGIQASWGNKLMFNTRIESALSGKGMWKDAILSGRCIVPAASFFEVNTHKAAQIAGHCEAQGDTAHCVGARDGERKRAGALPDDNSFSNGEGLPSAFEFCMLEPVPCLLAGVVLQGRVSIVTAEPNAVVAQVHPRMPLALRFKEVATWFEGELFDIAALADRNGVEFAAWPDRRRAKGAGRRSEALPVNQLSLF